jgi:RimJ/RimL family protein N-acetyltransferase
MDLHSVAFSKNKDIEVGYKLIKSAWGKGYATELAKFFIDWGFQELKLSHIVAAAYPQHKASIHIKQKGSKLRPPSNQEILLF